MKEKDILTIIGLGLDLLGAIILAISTLKSKKWLKDEFIDKSGTDEKGESWFERRGFRKIQRLTLIGLGLIILGFVFQLIAQFNLSI